MANFRGNFYKFEAELEVLSPDTLQGTGQTIAMSRFVRGYAGNQLYEVAKMLNQGEPVIVYGDVVPNPSRVGEYRQLLKGVAKTV